MTRLAVRLGFDASVVWNHPKNALLKHTRSNPDILCPGDILYVPQPIPKYLPVSVGAVNTFTATVPVVQVNLTLLYEGAPLANVPCQVEIGSNVLDMTIGEDGLLSFSMPITCEEALVVIEDPPARYPVRPGHVDPHEEPSGIRHRLGNLGYLDDLEADDESVAGSISVFQFVQGLPQTGLLDDATLAKLLTAHGH